MPKRHRSTPPRHPMSVPVRHALFAASLAALPSFAQQPAAAPAPAKDAKTLDAVNVSSLGSRGAPRSEDLSAVPIDIISGDQFHQQ